jgi:hypothetical protein
MVPISTGVELVGTKIVHVQVPRPPLVAPEQTAV